jgi:hypothetical protein
MEIRNMTGIIILCHRYGLFIYPFSFFLFSIFDNGREIGNEGEKRRN